MDRGIQQSNTIAQLWIFVIKHIFERKSVLETVKCFTSSLWFDGATQPRPQSDSSGLASWKYMRANRCALFAYEHTVQKCSAVQIQWKRLHLTRPTRLGQYFFLARGSTPHLAPSVKLARFQMTRSHVPRPALCPGPFVQIRSLAFEIGYQRGNRRGTVQMA